MTERDWYSMVCVVISCECKLKFEQKTVRRLRHILAKFSQWLHIHFDNSNSHLSSFSQLLILCKLKCEGTWKLVFGHKRYCQVPGTCKLFFVTARITYKTLQMGYCCTYQIYQMSRYCVLLQKQQTQVIFGFSSININWFALSICNEEFFKT